MNLPIIGRLIDERFLNHRLRSTSIGGVVGATVAGGLFAYRYYVDGIWSWDLLAVLMTMAAVKIAVLTWYLITD